MTATTWVQIIKACLLLGGGITLMLLTLAQFGWSLREPVHQGHRVAQAGRKADVTGLADG
jgi:cation/acetate symporter